MNTNQVTKESLLPIAIGAISYGFNLMPQDRITGIIMVVLGAGLIFGRGYLKKYDNNSQK